MTMASCIPVIPSADLGRSLRFWVKGLGFATSSEMREDERLVFCMLRNRDVWFMLNQRAGGATRPPDNYEGIRLYWAPEDIHGTRERLKLLGHAVSELVDREYGQTEFTLTDDDGFAHCFGVPTYKGEKHTPSQTAGSHWSS